MYIPRFYESLDEYLEPGKVLIIYGSRRVGKTTLVERYLEKTNLKYRFVTGDNIEAREVLSSQNLSQISKYVEGYDLIAIDEAQYVPNIGLGLKLIVDHHKDIRVLATGSSFFDLANQVGEPLTGRKQTLRLYPLSQLELLNKLGNRYDLEQQLEERLVFGSYPNVVAAPNKQSRVKYLSEITQSYLLKDVLALENIKAPKALGNLLKLVAFQVGNEVAHSELGSKVGLDKNTVSRYLDLLEKTFVLINLGGFSRNLRKEVTKKGKYYFYDTGVRNAIIANFNELDLRDDVGALWKNFLVVERIKKQQYGQISSNNYFWRTWDQDEIDWVEEREGKLFGYEFKWQPRDVTAPKDWVNNYPQAEFTVIHPKNYLGFVA